MADITNQLQAAAGAAGGGVGGSYLLVGSLSNRVVLLDHTTPGTLTNAALYSQGQGFAYGVSFSPDGGYVASGGAFSVAQVTLLTRTTPSSFTFAATYSCAGSSTGINGVKFSPDSDYIAVGTNSSTSEVTLLNHTTPGSLSLSTTYNIVNGTAYSVDFDPSGDYLVVGHARSTGNPSVTLLNHTTPGSLSLSATYDPGSGNNCFNASFSPDGNYIACTILPSIFGTTSSFLLLNHTTPGALSLATTYAILNNGDNAIYSCSWSPDGSYIVTGGFNASNIGIVTLLSHSAGTVSLATTYQVGDGSSGNGSLCSAFSPDGNYIAANGTTGGGSSGTVGVILLNHSAGTLSLATTYALSYVASLDWSPD